MAWNDKSVHNVVRNDRILKCASTKNRGRVHLGRSKDSTLRQILLLLGRE